MNWLAFIVLSGGILLLGLAIVFLLVAEIVGKSRESGRKAGGVSGMRSRPVPKTKAFSSASSEPAEYLPDLEVSSREKTALQTSGSQQRPESRPAAEDDSDREKPGSAPH
jgi:hypothetical protein